MVRVLVPVDGSESALRAVTHVIGRLRRGEEIDMRLLNVQSPVYSANITRFLTSEMVDVYYRAESEAALEKAKRLVEEAGLSHATHTTVGPIAETIAEYVAQNSCDEVVMGTRGLGALANLVLGSVATKVLHLVEVPVTLVK
jgi:nucleotide-binding universal stress UspA family protein